jgi:DNA-binding response OmpR family regulator
VRAQEITEPGGGRVLVVDDDADMRELVGAVLDGLGIEYDVAESGEEALVAVTGGIPRLIVLDVRMTGLSGLDVCRKVRQIGGSAGAILLLSAESAPEDVEAGFAAGANDYLTKPFRPAELGRRVRRLLDAMPSTGELAS